MFLTEPRFLMSSLALSLTRSCRARVFQGGEMEILDSVTTGVLENWPIWFLSAAMVVAAVIDGVKLKVPNWLTYPLMTAGWAFSSFSYAAEGLPWWQGLIWSVLVRLTLFASVSFASKAS